jgi:hypothetical protein
MDSIQRYFRDDGMHQIDKTKEMSKPRGNLLNAAI